MRDLSELLTDIAVQARQLLRTDVAYLALVEGDGMSIRYMDGAVGPSFGDIRLSLTQGLAGRVIGVKLFSAIAGVALLLAAVFFLRYSVEHGWLQPPVRVAIGIIVAIALLVACELRVARNYP